MHPWLTKLGVPDTEELETRRSTETGLPPLASLKSFGMSGSFSNAHLEIEPDDNAVRIQVKTSAWYASLLGLLDAVSMGEAQCYLTGAWGLSIKRAI